MKGVLLGHNSSVTFTPLWLLIYFGQSFSGGSHVSVNPATVRPQLMCDSRFSVTPALIWLALESLRRQCHDSGSYVLTKLEFSSSGVRCSPLHPLSLISDAARVELSDQHVPETGAPASPSGVKYGICANYVQIYD